MTIFNLSVVMAMSAWLLTAGSGSAQALELRHSVVERPGGVHLAVVEAGDPQKPGVLFIHGFAQSHLSFRRQFASDLVKHYHLVAFDLRGQGASDKPSDPSAYTDTKTWGDDVAAVMAATGLRKPLLVGWSFGGYVAMDYVQHHGVDGIAGIVMVGSPGGMLPFLPETPAQRKARELSVSADLADNIEAARLTAAGFTTPQATPEEKETLFATEIMMPTYVRKAMALRSYDHADLLHKVATPILISVGSEDPYVPPQSAETLRAALPNARVSTYPGVGHLPFVQQTDRFNQELDAFARETGAN